MVSLNCGDGPVGLQYPCQMNQRALWVRQVFQHEAHEDMIEGLIFEGQLEKVGLNEWRAGNASALHIWRRRR